MIKVQQAHFFQGNTPVLKDLDVNFNAGEFWGIIGKNGVGKSTLLQALSGLSGQYTGSISIDNHDIRLLDHVSRARKVSYLLQEQEPCLAFQVCEAIGMGRFPWPSSKQQDQQITEQVMALCQITTLKDRSILKLSGGERRKVEIATCLAQQADYLLLDEPLNHLDVVYQHHIMQVFQNYSQQQAVVMVCHDLEAVKNYCSHVLMLLGNDCYLSGTSATMLTEINLKRLFDGS